jgi:hypothetical protein
MVWLHGRNHTIFPNEQLMRDRAAGGLFSGDEDDGFREKIVRCGWTECDNRRAVWDRNLLLFAVV